MNKFELSFNILRIPVDILTILLSAWLAFIIRTSDTVISIRPILYTLESQEYMLFVIIFSFISFIMMSLTGLYSFNIGKGILSELYGIFSSISTSILGVILYYFFYSRDIFSSRFFIIALWFFTISLLFLNRMIIRWFQSILIEKYKLGLNKVAIILGSKSGDSLYEFIKENPETGYKIVYHNQEFDQEKLEKLAKSKKIDTLILTKQDYSLEEQVFMNDFCDEYKLDFQYIPNTFDTYKMDIRTLAGVILFRVKRTTLEGWGSVIKRVFDIIFASLFLIVFSPVYIITAIMIKLESEGPVFYKSIRVGPGNSQFAVYKFRSMYQELCTDESDPKSIELEKKILKEKGTKSGPVNKIKDDPRVTKIGKFLRKTSIDELPQFFNVLIGNMSVVGPRPHQPREVASYEKHHKKVLTIKPGITGMAQVNGRSDLSFDEEVLYDTFYIENWNIVLDLIIIIKTPLAIFGERKAD